MRIEKLDSCRCDIDIPLSKVGMCQNQQIHDIGETKWNGRQKDREEAHTLLDVVQRVDVDTLHDLHLEAGDIEELVHTSEVDGKPREHEIEDCQAHQEKPNAMFVGLIERSLGLDHASQS